MNTYPEIEAINKIYVKYKVEIRFSASDFLEDKKEYRAVNFKIDGNLFCFYVEDELDDIKYGYPLLNFCLVLRELEGYALTSDYLIWCQERYLDPKNEITLQNFRNLGSIYQEVEKIESFVSDWDFEMGSGASWELRNKGSH